MTNFKEAIQLEKVSKNRRHELSGDFAGILRTVQKGSIIFVRSFPDFVSKVTSIGFLWLHRCVALRSSASHWASSGSIIKLAN